MIYDFDFVGDGGKKNHSGYFLGKSIAVFV